MDSKSIQILEFLKNYQRITSPEEEEIDKWLNSKTQQFPTSLAKQRLPFHSINEARNNPKTMFKLLTKEFVIETYQQWLTEAKTFKIGPIAIRVYAAQNSISHVLSQRKTDPNDPRWSTTPLISEEVLKEVFECLDGITDYFKATSAAHWIVNRLPKGSDKLMVAKKCLEFATQWRDEIGDEG